MGGQEAAVLKGNARIDRTFPNEWDDVDPDAGWVRSPIEPRGAGPTPMVSILAGLLSVALLLASLACGLR